MAKPVIKLNNMFKAEKEDDGSTIEKLKYFSGYTTAHGFGRLVESKSYVRKVFWVMACLGAFTMFSCQVVWLAQDYISKPVETYITLKHVKVRSLVWAGGQLLAQFCNQFCSEEMSYLKLVLTDTNFPNLITRQKVS